MDRWTLVTTSYAAFKPDLGVPLATSIGKPKNFPYPRHDLKVLMPWVTFRKPPFDRDMTAAAKRYKEYLTEKKATIEHVLDEYAARYDGTPLCLLCYESKGEAMRGGCHRRWFADWVQDSYGFHVPEVGVKPVVVVPQAEPEPMLW